MSYKIDRILNTISFFSNIKINHPPEKSRALYLGWIGFNNLGDEALYHCIKKMFIYKLIFNSSREFDKLLFKEKAIKNFKVHFLGGGTLINRNEGIINTLISYKKSIPKSVVFGSGVANDYFWKEFEVRADRSEDWRSYLNSCVFVGVRGPDSLRYMQQLGVNKAVVTGDPVLYLGRDKAPLPKPKKKRIGLNFANTNNILWGKSDRFVENVMAALISLLLEQRWEISFFNVYANDTKCYFDFVERNGFRDKIRFFDASNCSFDSALNYFDSIDVFVGEKLHASVFAACTSTPFIMLEYRPKCLDFMKSIKYEKYNLRTDCMDEKAILELVDEIYNKSNSIQKYIFENVLSMKNSMVSSALKVFQGDAL